MKQRDAGKGSIAMALVVVSSVNFSNSAEAQTSTYRGIARTSRTTPAAERIRRDANSIHCKKFPSNQRAINSGRQILSYCSHTNGGGIKLY
jgi:hypothetical protein